MGSVMPGIIAASLSVTGELTPESFCSHPFADAVGLPVSTKSRSPSKWRIASTMASRFCLVAVVPTSSGGKKLVVAAELLAETASRWLEESPSRDS